ncbi:hypothetical protein P5P81_19375 [Tritonibacter mobilis]|nr:hypothetical protein [Tritonibacter mobilis]
MAANIRSRYIFGQGMFNQIITKAAFILGLSLAGALLLVQKLSQGKKMPHTSLHARIGWPEATPRHLKLLVFWQGKATPLPKYFCHGSPHRSLHISM